MRTDPSRAGICKLLPRIARAFCGIPDYEAYLAHCRLHHPEREPASCAAFHRERQATRYARGRSRCC